MILRRVGAQIGSTLNEGSCVRLRPLHLNHVWSFDFMQAQTHDGRSLHVLKLIAEHSRACLALEVARRINSLGVIEALADATCLHGIPEHIRYDNGPEGIAKALRKWVAKTSPQIQYIAPGSPRGNGYCERTNGKLRDECPRQEVFYSLKYTRAPCTEGFFSRPSKALPACVSLKGEISSFSPITMAATAKARPPRISGSYAIAACGFCFDSFYCFSLYTGSKIAPLNTWRRTCLSMFLF